MHQDVVKNGIRKGIICSNFLHLFFFFFFKVAPSRTLKQASFPVVVGKSSPGSGFKVRPGILP